jgi:hypothetical protein
MLRGEAVSAERSALPFVIAPLAGVSGSAPAFHLAQFRSERVDLVAPDADILQAVIIHVVENAASPPVAALLAQCVE